jgi:hypothetical protein
MQISLSSQGRWNPPPLSLLTLPALGSSSQAYLSARSSQQRSHLESIPSQIAQLLLSPEGMPIDLPSPTIFQPATSFTSLYFHKYTRSHSTSHIFIQSRETTLLSSDLSLLIRCKTTNFLNFASTPRSKHACTVIGSESNSLPNLQSEFGSQLFAASDSLEKSTSSIYASGLESAVFERCGWLRKCQLLSFLHPA